MKRHTFAILFMALTTAVQAQDVNLGVTAGPNLSTATTTAEGAEQPKFLVGFQLGGFAEFRLADKISLRPELQYITLGYKFPEEAAEEVPGLMLRSSYITLPVTVEYALTDKLKVGLGPYASLKLSVKAKFTPYPGAADDYEEGYFDAVDESEHFSNLDVGLRAGLSYQVTPKIGINVRYNHGLANIQKEEGFDGSKVRYRYVTLGVSYTIR